MISQLFNCNGWQVILSQVCALKAKSLSAVKAIWFRYNYSHLHVLWLINTNPSLLTSHDRTQNLNGRILWKIHSEAPQATWKSSAVTFLLTSGVFLPVQVGKWATLSSQREITEIPKSVIFITTFEVQPTFLFDSQPKSLTDYPEPWPAAGVSPIRIIGGWDVDWGIREGTINLSVEEHVLY